MNVIQRQAEDFLRYKHHMTEDAQSFINEVRSQLYEYKRDSYKIEFLEFVRQRLKVEFDDHVKVCTRGTNCRDHRFNEDVLFFVQQEIEDINDQLTDGEFSLRERSEISDSLQVILTNLDKLKLGQEITYNDLYDAIQEAKEYYFLNKRNWIQLLSGKLTEMIAGGLITETVSKDILKLVNEKYESFLT